MSALVSQRPRHRGQSYICAMNVQFLLGVGLGLTGLGGYYVVYGWRWSRDEWMSDRRLRRVRQWR